MGIPGASGGWGEKRPGGPQLSHFVSGFAQVPKQSSRAKGPSLLVSFGGQITIILNWVHVVDAGYSFQGFNGKPKGELPCS